MTTRIQPVLVLAIGLLLCAATSTAQRSLQSLSLPHGEFSVGFRHQLFHDASRTYNRVQDFTRSSIARPIPVSVWYPALTSGPASRPMTVMDYLRVKRDEEEWETLPDSLIMGWFNFPDTPENRAIAQQTVRAVADAPPAPGKYPVIVYAASFLASSTENFALCELLASHGYLVLAVPGRGAGGRPMRGSAARNAEAQARDLEFLIAQLEDVPNADPERIALMDYSFGGLATTMVALRNKRIKALASLDGRSRYDYETIYASPTVQGMELEVPYLHAAQKIIPDEVLEADGIDPALNSDFRLFDSLRRAPAFALRFNDLSHRHFSTYGLLLQSADPRQDMPDDRTTEGYRWLAEYMLRFFHDYVHPVKSGGNFFTYSPAENGYLNERLEVNQNYQRLPPDPIDFAEFHDSVRRVGYDQLLPVYEQFLRRQPEFSIPEWKLNTLGLQLGFFPDTYDKGVAIYEFALRLYPDSANLWDSLGMIQQVNGDYPAAIRSFRRSLALNPGNGHAKMRLGQMGE